MENSNARWFMRNDGVLFVSIDDMLNEFSKMQKDNLNPPISVIIAGWEASKELALMELRSLQEAKNGKPKQPKG